MLQIRQEQLDALEESYFNRFIDRMFHHLKARFPYHLDEVHPTTLHETILTGVLRAEEYGIKDQNDIKRFLEYLIEYGTKFGDSTETNWAQKILHSNATGTEKMDRIDQYDLFVLTLGKADEGL